MTLLEFFSKFQRTRYSAVEPDEKLEEPGCRNDPQRLEGRLSRLLLMVLMVINLAILLLVVRVWSGKNSTRMAEETFVRKLITEVPREVKTFRSNSVYDSWPSAESSMAWKALAGPGKTGPHQGMVILENGTFLVSVFHQLHCLSSVREFILSVLGGEFDIHQLLEEYNSNLRNITIGKRGRLAHSLHCLDYIRQGIQCAGDISLEERTPVEGTNIGYIIWGTEHECRSWDYIWDYAGQHSF